MGIVVRFHPTGMTRQQYDDADRRLREAGVWPPDGMDYHVCFGQDGDLYVSERSGTHRRSWRRSVSD